MSKERVIIKKKRPVVQSNWKDKYKCTDYMFVSIGSQFGNGESKTKKIKLVPIKYHFKTCKSESLNRIEKKKLSQKDFEKYISDHYELERDKDFNVTRMYISDNTVIYLIIIKDFTKKVKSMKSLVALEMSNTNVNDDFQGIINCDKKYSIKKSNFSSSRSSSYETNINTLKSIKLFKTLIG